MKRVFLFSLLVVSMLLSCGTVEQSRRTDMRDADAENTLLAATPAKKPAWAHVVGRAEQGDTFFFSGESLGRNSEEDALKGALIDALSRVSAYFGLTVRSTTYSIEAEQNGNYSYNVGVSSTISGAPIKLKDFKEKGRYVEKWSRNGQVEYDARVLIAVPRAEMLRIKKEVEAKVAWGIVIKDHQFEQPLKRLVRELAAKKQLKIVPDQTMISDSFKFEDLQHAAQTAYFLLIKAEYQPPVKEGSAFFTKINLSATLISLLDGEEKWSMHTELKSGEYSADDAVSYGLKKAAQHLLSGY